MDRKSVFYVLTFAIILSLFSCKNEENTNRVFVCDTAQIQKISISKGKESSILVKNKKWTIDNTNIRAVAIKNLLKIIQLAQIEMPMDKNKVFDFKNTLSIEIQENKSLFYRIANQNGKTYVFDSLRNKKYIATIPGVAKQFAQYFYFNPLEWKSKKLLNFKISSIKKVVLNRISHHEKIEIFRDDKNWELLYNGKKFLQNKLRKEQIDSYLSYLSDLEYEKIEHDKHLKDSLQFELKIYSTHFDSLIISAYYKIVDKGPKSVHKPVEKAETAKPYDRNKFYIKLHNNSYLLECKYFNFDPILVHVDYFLKD